MPLAVLFVATLVAARTAEAGDKNRIKSVSFDDQGQSTTVRIKGSATPTFTVYKLERPNRVVLDIAGAELGAAVEKAQENGQTIAVATWAVNQIAAYELDDGGTMVRIVVTLARPGRYDVTADGDDLLVSVVARDDAPAKADPAALAEAKDAADKAKKDSETAKAARSKAEGDAAKAREQAETSKKEADKAKKALAEAKDAAAKAEKAGKADRERADRALAEAKAEAERTRKAAEQAKLEADRTKKSVEAAQAEAERTKQAAAQAKAEVERMQAEVIAAKAEAKAKGKEAAAAKADAAEHKKEATAAKADAAQRTEEATAAKADAAARKKEAAAAKADAAARKKEAEDARAEAERNKLEAAAAKAEADRRTKEAEQARQEARQARADADAAQKQAADKQRAAELAQQDAADQKRAAAAAKKEAAADKRDAAAMRAEAEQMLAEAKDRAHQAEAEAKAARKSQEAALAAQKQAEKSEAAARKAEAKAADERKSAQAALDKAEAAKAAGDRDADTRVAAAEERLRKAEQARTAAEDQRKQAEAVAATARDEAARRKAETADAVAAKGTAEKERKAAQQAADEAEQRAQRAEQLRKDEDAAARRAAEAKVAVEDAERAKAGKKELAAKRAEAKRLAKEAAAAKAAREGEESQLAAVIAERRQVEKDLEKARVARAEAEEATEAARREAAVARQQAEDARAEAEEAKRQAQVARDDAEQAKVAADQARDAERAAKKAATAEKAAAKKAAAAERAAAAEEAAIAKKEAAAARAAAKKDAEAAAKKETVAAPPVAKKPAAEPVAKPAAKSAVAVRDVAFQQDGDGARVIVELSGEVETEVVRSDRKSAELVLSGVSLPDKLQRKLDVSKFDGAVRAISTFQDPKDATRVRVVVELTGDATPRLEKVGSTLRWHFASAAPAVATKSKTTSKAKAKSKGKTQSIPAPVVGGYGASSAPVTSKSVAQAGGSRRKVYRGPTIDLDFKDADIHNLLRFLANIGRVSIVVPDDIKATVTVRLKRVPWDQALEVILASKGLWYRKEGSLYRIAPRKQLDAEDQAEAERIRAAVQSEAPEAEVFTLNYASAAETSDKLIPLLSPKGKIEVDSRTNSLIINDIRAHRRRIIDLAARLDTQTPQIMIEARIVEARSTYAREFGIQWGGRANASQAGGNATGLIFPNSIGIGGGADDRQTPTGGVSTPSDFAVNLPATVGTGAGGAIGLSLGSVGGNFNLNLRLSAAEDTGTVRIISSPKITVLNNTEASISQGVSIPISVVSAQGTQTQFVPADLSLTVTPYVSQRDCSIAMTINVTKNEPDFVNTGARGDPTILRKEANTRILVADGETTVMGGITTRNTGLAYNKVPFLGDLPVVGWLFKSRRENDDRTELLIFITPTITNKAFLRCE